MTNYLKYNFISPIWYDFKVFECSKLRKSLSSSLSFQHENELLCSWEKAFKWSFVNIATNSGALSRRGEDNVTNFSIWSSQISWYSISSLVCRRSQKSGALLMWQCDEISFVFITCDRNYVLMFFKLICFHRIIVWFISWFIACGALVHAETVINLNRTYLWQ